MKRLGSLLVALYFSIRRFRDDLKNFSVLSQGTSGRISYSERVYKRDN